MSTYTICFLRQNKKNYSKIITKILLKNSSEIPFTDGRKNNFDSVVSLESVSVPLNPFMPSGLFCPTEWVSS